VKKVCFANDDEALSNKSYLVYVRKCLKVLSL